MSDLVTTAILVGILVLLLVQHLLFSRLRKELTDINTVVAHWILEDMTEEERREALRDL